MSYTYANRKRGESAAPKTESAAPQPSMDALRAGVAKPTQEQMGRRVDLPDAMRAKMENAFGADLSAVKLYESEAVADAGANAVAQGSNIAFAPGMLDFTSYGGQALLGHEISHVVSQQRGEVTGNGFLNDHALEARADREGAMAAAGRQIAMPTATMSSASAAPAAGPMQADKKENKIAKHQSAEADAYDKMIMAAEGSRARKKAANQMASAQKWRRFWGDSGSNPLLSLESQLARAKARHTNENNLLDEAAYSDNLDKIIAGMGEEQFADESLSIQASDCASLNSNNGLQHTNYYVNRATGERTCCDRYTGAAVYFGSISGNEHKRRMSEWDKMTGNQMTATDIQAIDAQKMRHAIEGVRLAATRHQAKYEDTTQTAWENEVAMEQGAYNPGTLTAHMAAAANIGGDANTTLDDRIAQYNSFLDGMSARDGESEQDTYARQDEVMRGIKGNYRQYLQGLKSRFGTDLENETRLSLARNDRYKQLSTSLGPNAAMPLAFATQFSDLFDPENEEDQEYLQLARYYRGIKSDIDQKGHVNDSQNGLADEYDYRGLITDAKRKMRH